MQEHLLHRCTGERRHRAHSCAAADLDGNGDIIGNIVIGGSTVDTGIAGTCAVTQRVSEVAGTAALEVAKTDIVNAAAARNGGRGSGSMSL